jgi:hypothetical protein
MAYGLSAFWASTVTRARLDRLEGMPRNLDFHWAVKVDAMTYKLVHGTVFDSPRQIIHVVRVVDEILDLAEIDDIAEKMRNYALSRQGEQTADVVVVQGSSKETLRLFGDPRAKALVRAALFNAAVSWSPVTFD